MRGSFFVLAWLVVPAVVSVELPLAVGLLLVPVPLLAQAWVERRLFAGDLTALVSRGCRRVSMR